jgi:16S rRNA (cytosine967-C5)-methyltransferase
LIKVEDGAYASDILRQLASGLNRRDAGLASQIVFGCLRYQEQLDYLISGYAGRDAKNLDSSVKIALRMAVFQLRYLDRIPPHAAVNDAVELVKRRKRAAAGLVNAVLRKTNRDDVVWPDVPTATSCPTWLLARWTEHFGEETARNIAEAALQEPASYIRVPPGTTPPPGVELEETSVAGCFRLMTGSPVGMRLHDIGSQAIVPLLDLRPGMSYLDVCAAPGNKTMQALETPLGRAVACDVSLKRLREMPPACARVVLDATEPLPFNCKFDRIFIDAPCSGTGTLAHNPEIKWRITAENIVRLSEKQFRIAMQAVQALTPGGKLLYATCSLEREENEDVIKRLLTEHTGLRCERELWRIPGRDEGDGFYAAVISFK